MLNKMSGSSNLDISLKKKKESKKDKPLRLSEHIQIKIIM